LEEMGFVPFHNSPMLMDAPTANKNAPKYVIITKDDDTYSVADKVDAANDVSNNIKVVLGTEIATQGLDFKRMREVHLLEPWWNMSRMIQVIGRGIRRCSHVSLPPLERNTTVYMHSTCRRTGDRETLDQQIYRYAFNKQAAIMEVERIIAKVAIDCGLYEDKRQEAKERHVSSQGKAVEVKRRSMFGDAEGRPVCDCKWNSPSRSATDSSTLHPYVYKNMVDLLAWDVKDFLQTKVAASFDDILAALKTSELLLALTLTAMMNPITSWRWIENKTLVYRNGYYVLVHRNLENSRFTMAEVQMGFLFSDNMITKIKST
jgi:Helicase conserved C-terminal domain